jgi:hypothetical protein
MTGVTLSDPRIAPTAAPGPVRSGTRSAPVIAVAVFAALTLPVVTGKQVYLHPDWMWGLPAGRPVSDLALVELTREVQLAFMPVAGRQVGTEDPVRLIGWGLTVFPPPGHNDPDDAAGAEHHAAARCGL